MDEDRSTELKTWQVYSFAVQIYRVYSMLFRPLEVPWEVFFSFFLFLQPSFNRKW